MSGDYGTSERPFANFTADKVVMTPLTSDPSDLEEGDWWYRSDLDSGDKIGTFRFYNGAETWDIPVFAEGTSESSVEEVRAVETPNGEGYVPLAAQSNAAFPKLAYQHSGSRFALHDAVYTIPASAVSRWEFEQDVTDTWGDNDGTDSTSAGFTTDAAVGNYAKSFDGVDDYVDIPDFQQFSAYSISSWANADVLDGNERFVIGFKSNNWVSLSVNASDEWRHYHHSDGGEGAQILTTSATTNTWVHLCGTWDGSTIEFYVDGNSVGTQAMSGMSSQGYTNYIGADNYGSFDQRRFFDGNIDDIRIYDRALSSSEVSNLYNTGSISG